MADLAGVVEANLSAGTGSGADAFSWRMFGDGSKYLVRHVALINLANGELSWAEWEALLAAPASFKVPQLKNAATVLWVEVGGSPSFACFAAAVSPCVVCIGAPQTCLNHSPHTKPIL
jgi:hypothetical protein